MYFHCNQYKSPGYIWGNRKQSGLIPAIGSGKEHVSMRKSAIRWALVVGAAAFATVAMAADGAGQAPSSIRDLEKYVGRDLVNDTLAQKADVIPLLPQSCPPFYLRDEHNKIIDPTIEEDVNRPVNFRQTCGGPACHDVQRITEGYHFQMGADQLYEPNKPGEHVPVDKGPAYFGKWRLFEQRELSPQHFRDPNYIDETPFEWIQNEGVFHPGGGPAEYDRAGRRYDVVQTQDPGLASAYDGDYYGAEWHKSGVAGPDCLICHLETYEYSLRAQQLKKYNFKWAATEASGFASVEGSVQDGDLPRLSYNKEMFGVDGKVHLKIRRPSDRNCLFCHHMLGVQKRGVTWHDNYMQDMHTQQGMACIDCHSGDIRHHFAKGHSSSMHVRDDLDGSIMSCEECHNSEEFGAPKYDHPGFPPIHFERMSCESCHIPRTPIYAATVVDTLTGKNIKLPHDIDEKTTASKRFGAFWTKTLVNEIGAAAFPLTPAEIDRAATLRLPADDGDFWGYFTDAGGKLAPWAENLRKQGALTVAQVVGDHVDNDYKRRLMLVALMKTLEKGAEPSCVFRGQAYRMYGDKLQAIPSTLNAPRVGYVKEKPVSWAYHDFGGDQKLRAEWYQLGAFWAFDDGTTIRPVYIKETAEAWELLTQEEYKYFCLPAMPLDNPAVAMPDPATVEEAQFRSAWLKKFRSYATSEVERLGIFDDNLDGWPEANTEQEMGTMAWALVRTMERLPKPEVYYIKGTSAYKITVEDVNDPPFGESWAGVEAIPDGEPGLALFRYELDEGTQIWQVAEAPRPMKMFKYQVEAVDMAAAAGDEKMATLASLAQRLPWTISHGVVPAQQALGANGCTECHSMESEFFFGKAMVDPYGPDALPITQPNYQKLDYLTADLAFAAFRESFLKHYALWCVLLVLLVIVGHYAMFGAKTGPNEDKLDTLRFTTFERVSHLGLMVSVTYLSFTGFSFLLGYNDFLGELSRYLHLLAGYLAAASFLAVTVVWVKKMLPEKGDREWLMHMGGYLGAKGHFPAGKFNAGQKILFWMALVMMAVLVISGLIMGLCAGQRFAMQSVIYTIHDIAGLGMILLLLGHIYLGVCVNPHSVRTIFGGFVSSIWAKRHHPNWEPVADLPEPD